MPFEVRFVAHQDDTAREQHFTVLQEVQDLLGLLERAAIHHRVDDDKDVDVVC